VTITAFTGTRRGLTEPQRAILQFALSQLGSDAIPRDHHALAHGGAPDDVRCLYFFDN